MMLIGLIVMFFIIFIFAALKIRNEKLSIKKYVSLIFLPPLLLGIVIYISDMYTYFFSIEEHRIYFPTPTVLLFPAVYGLILMSPALMFFAVHILSLEKKLAPSPWKLFLLAGLVAGVSGLPYLLVAPLGFIFVPMLTGSLAMMLVYYISKRSEK